MEEREKKKYIQTNLAREAIAPYYFGAGESGYSTRIHGEMVMQYALQGFRTRKYLRNIFENFPKNAFQNSEIVTFYGLYGDQKILI